MPDWRQRLLMMITFSPITTDAIPPDNAEMRFADAADVIITLMPLPPLLLLFRAARRITLLPCHIMMLRHACCFLPYDIFFAPARYFAMPLPFIIFYYCRHVILLDYAITLFTPLILMLLRRTLLICCFRRYAVRVSRRRAMALRCSCYYGDANADCYEMLRADYAAFD